MKKTVIVLVFLLIGIVSQVIGSEPIGVFVNSNTDSIQFINPLTQELSPSLLKGTLGNYSGSLLNVVITSDGKKAIVSDVRNRQLIFIDISGGFQGTPVILGRTDLLVNPLDITLTPDDKYLLVTTGMTPKEQARASMPVADYNVATINMSTMEANYFRSDNIGFFSSVDITPDGKTVLFLDYFLNQIHSYDINGATGELQFKEIVYLPLYYPSSLSISPDGKTVLVAVESSYKIIALSFYDDNKLHLNGLVDLPHKSGQSFTFSKDGTKAYCFTNNASLMLSDSQSRAVPTNQSQVVTLNITAPGVVTVGDVIPLSIPKGSTIPSFSKNIAIDPSGNYLYITNAGTYEGVVEITVIDLITQTEVNQLHANGIPLGIAFGTINN